MKSDIRFRLYALALTIIAMSLIWVVGSGDAAQPVLQQAVYGQGVYAQAQGEPNISQSNSTPKHSIAYYTKMMADIAYKIHTRYMEDVDPESLIQAGIEGMLSISTHTA